MCAAEACVRDSLGAACAFNSVQRDPRSISRRPRARSPKSASIELPISFASRRRTLQQ